MELQIYKGFDKAFLEKLKIDDALINSSIDEKVDFLKFTSKTKKNLDIALSMMDENDSKWITYEEFCLIKDRISLSVADYGLKATVIVNNLFADVFPITVSISPSAYEEIKRVEKVDIRDIFSEETLKVLKFYSCIYRVGDIYYGTYYNYEYDKSARIDSTNYYSNDIEAKKINKEADFSIYINDDLESYLRALTKIETEKPKSISIRDTGSRASKRISDSIKAYCIEKHIDLFVHYEELKEDDEVLNQLVNIAKQDLKIPNFKEFRKIKFYKNPELNNEIVEISQAQIIKEIINQAENAYSESADSTYRDLFITASTGAGKSVMFQVPAVYLANKYKKLTIIIEPVIALMEDQKNSLIQRGFNRVEAFNSNLITQVEREKVLQRIKDGEVDLLYLSPETLLSYSLDTITGSREIGLLIVDEAHIVTTWGVGFRPDYWYLGGYINNVRNVIQSGHHKNKISQKFPICAFTATAINGGIDDTVNETIISLYMENPIKYIGYARRDDISFDINLINTNKLGMTVYENEKGATFLNRVYSWIKNKEKTVVYFPYASIAKNAFMGFKGFANAKYSSNDVGLYTGGNKTFFSDEQYKAEKQADFDKFKNGEKTVMFATKAFGMGVDVNDIKNVYHYAVTGNLSDYVQEIGRAARAKGMNGFAITDFYSQDLTFIQRLFGMSQIRQYQINKVLAGIYAVYETKKSQSFLISPQSFTYIFEGISKDEDGAINKLKTCLLMLEKDFYDKYSFKVLISRPRSIFTKAFICIDKNNKEKVLNSKYGFALKFVAKGRDGEPVPGAPDQKIIDIGDIYSLDLKAIWEKYYSNLSFPQFKFWYFKSKTYDGDDKVNVLEEIQPYIFIRQKITIKARNNKVFNDIRPLILNDLNYVSKVLSTKFRKKYFTIEEFSNAISSQFGKTKSRIIANSILDIVDPDHKVVKPRKNESGTGIYYFISNGTFDSYLKRSILKSRFMSAFTNNFSDEFSQFTSFTPNSVDEGCLKVLSVFDYIDYEITGGEEPEIFIRLNDPNKVGGIVSGSIKYANNYVITAKEKHERDVNVLLKFFTELKTDEDRWNYIERYFLGENVCFDSSYSNYVFKQVSLESIIDDSKSMPSIGYKTWDSASILFDNQQLSIIDDFKNLSVPMPKYFLTKFKENLFSDDPIMCWPEANVLIFGSDATDTDMNVCKSKGWTAFRILELDPKVLMKKVL